MEFFKKGKRGEIFLDKIKGKKVVIKRKRRESKALNAIENEAYWLRKLNKKEIGPKFISFKDGELMMEFVEGEFFGDYINKRGNFSEVSKEVLLQCRDMDVMRVNKFEMHKPIKHIIIRKGKINRKNVVLVDFERCRNSEKPKNVTQFCQFLIKCGWKVNRKKLEILLRKYKKDFSLKTFKEILLLLR